MKSAPPTRNDLKIADQKGRIALGSRHAGKRFSVREEEDGTTILTPVLVVPEKNYAPLLSMLDESFAALESLTGNWDGRGSPAPSPTLVRHAREMLALMQAGVISRGIPWTAPHIGSDECGQITLEWWQNARSLTIFIRSEDRTDYLKAWGSDIENDMEDGEIVRLTDFAMLSKWLSGEAANA